MMDIPARYRLEPQIQDREDKDLIFDGLEMHKIQHGDILGSENGELSPGFDQIIRLFAQNVAERCSRGENNDPLAIESAVRGCKFALEVTYDYLSPSNTLPIPLGLYVLQLHGADESADKLQTDAQTYLSSHPNISQLIDYYVHDLDASFEKQYPNEVETAAGIMFMLVERGLADQYVEDSPELVEAYFEQDDDEPEFILCSETMLDAKLTDEVVEEFAARIDGLRQEFDDPLTDVEIEFKDVTTFWTFNGFAHTLTSNFEEVDPSVPLDPEHAKVIRRAMYLFVQLAETVDDTFHAYDLPLGKYYESVCFQRHLVDALHHDGHEYLARHPKLAEIFNEYYDDISPHQYNSWIEDIYATLGIMSMVFDKSLETKYGLETSKDES